MPFQGTAELGVCAQDFRPEGLYDETTHGGEKGMRPRGSVPVLDDIPPNPKNMHMDREDDTAHGGV